MPAPAPFSGLIDSLTYVAFEDQFRTTSEIRSRVEDYVPVFAGASNVVTWAAGAASCDALRDSGLVRGLGTSADQGKNEQQRREAGSPGLRHRRQAFAAACLVAVQVVEHFTPAYLTKFLEAAYHALKPGAPIVLETINPNCWMAFFETYIRDLTHQQPLHPETLRLLVQASGFSNVDAVSIARIGRR
jgi:O-antigen chain-terminating methyltransferase